MSQSAYFQKELLKLCRLVEIATEREISEIIPMSGGLTNHNYKIVLPDGFTVAARIPGEGTEAYIDRAGERFNLTLMGTLGIAPEIYYYDTATGIQLTEYIHADTMHPEDFQNNQVLLGKAAMLMRTYHQSGLKQKNTFSPPEKIRAYREVLTDSGFQSDFEQTDALLQQLKRVEEALAETAVEKVPGHNDPLSENFMYDGDKLTLIDWEFSGMNDPFFDLAAFTVENRLNEADTDFFLGAYCNRPPQKKEYARLLINKFLLDAFVFHWALMQLNAGKEHELYHSYGKERIERALAYTEDPFFAEALTLL